MDHCKQIKYFPTLPKHLQYMYFSKTENMGYKKKLNIEKKCLHVMFLGNAEKSADKKLISDLWKMFLLAPV